MAEPSDKKRLATLDAKFLRAHAFRSAGEIRSAETLYRELLTGYTEWPDRLAMTGINLAQVLQQSGRLKQAAEQYELTLELARTHGDADRVAKSLSGMATIAQEQGDRAAAERLIVGATNIFRELGDQVGVGNQLGNLGLLRQSQGDSEAALRYFTQAASAFTAAGHAIGTLGVLQCVGELHRRQGEYEEAATAHRRALELAETHCSRVAEANSRRALGQIARARGDLAEAEAQISTGLAIHRRMGDVRGELAALIDIAMVDFSLGRTTNALKHLDESIERSEARGLPLPRLKALLNRALYQLDTGQVEAIESDLAQAHEILKRVDDPAAWNVWSVTTARTKIRSAQWDEAEGMLRDELKRAETANLGSVRPPILGLLASIAALRGDIDEAKTLFEDSERMYRALGDIEGARLALLGTTRLLTDAGRFERAQSALDRLVTSLGEERCAQPLLQAEVHLVYANVHDLRGDYAPALEDARKAAALFRKGGFEMSALGARLCELKILVRLARTGGEAPTADLPEALRSVAEGARALRCPTMAIMADATLANGLALGGRDEEAATLARDALARAHDLSFPEGEAHALEALAHAERDGAHIARAVEILRDVGAPVRAARLGDEWARDSGLQ